MDTTIDPTSSNPMTAPERLQAALVALRDDSTSLAIEQLEALLAEQPDHPAGLLYLGLAYARCDRLREAERTLSRARTLAPLEPLPHYNLGRLYHRLGQPADAASCYQETLRLDPHHAPARAALSELTGLLPPEMLRERPLLEQQRVQSLDLLSVIRLGLLSGLLTAVGILLVAAGFAFAVDDYSLLAIGGVGALMAIPSLLIGALVQALIFNLTARWLGGIGLELRCLRADWFELRELDAFALARIWTAQSVAYALLQMLLNLPSFLLMIGAAASGTSGGAGAVVGIMVGTLLILLLTNVFVIGATFAGAVLACSFYNTLAATIGGIRFEHRFVDRLSELRRLEVAPALATVALLHAPLLPFLWLTCALLSGPAPGVALRLAVLVPLALLAVAWVAILCYNGCSVRFGGLRLELRPD